MLSKNIVGVMVLYNDGHRAIKALIAMKKICTHIFVIHDGPSDVNTKQTISNFGLSLTEFPRRYCKEAHLVHFFYDFISKNLSNKKYLEVKWCLHLDSDEVLTDSLIEEIRSLPDTSHTSLIAAADHIIEDNKKLKYKKSSNRIYKPIMMNLTSNHRIVGLPHKGLEFKLESSLVLKNKFNHNAEHVHKNLYKQIEKEWNFAINDAFLRTKPIQIFNDYKIENVSNFSKKLSLSDRLLNKYPILVAFPVSFYSFLLSIKSLFEARNFLTLNYEFKMLFARSIYYLRLAWLINLNKKDCGLK